MMIKLLCAIRDGISALTEKITELGGGSNTTNTLLEKLLESVNNITSVLNDNVTVLDLQCYKDENGKAIKLHPVDTFVDGKVTSTTYVDQHGKPYEGKVTVHDDPCECMKDCPDCTEDCETCAVKDGLTFGDDRTIDDLKKEADDNGSTAWVAKFKITNDVTGVTETVTSDLLANGAAGNKSAWYEAVFAKLMELVPAITVTLANDVPVTSNEKPQYTVIYEPCVDEKVSFTIEYEMAYDGEIDLYAASMDAGCANYAATALNGVGPFNPDPWESNQ